MSFGFARHFVACNRCDLTRFAPFLIGDKRYGFMRKDLIADIIRDTKLFQMSGDAVELLPSMHSYGARTEALKQATKYMCKRYGKPLRNEIYAVTENIHAEAVAEIDRVAVPWYGVAAFGVHVNGYVRKKNGIHLWIGKRADDRPAEPGKLDNLVGGGQPLGLSLEQNLCKEAQEEAGIEAPLALTAKRAREISYRMEWQEGVRTDTLYIYDLELPEDFVPTNMDGEVAEFILLPLPEVADIVRDTDRFKFNCNLVVIDFLMRHHHISAMDPEYVALTKWLHPAERQSA
jgi:8-oxo-dGTP pyrophosphatase MutT (NUDIX family)